MIASRYSVVQSSSVAGFDAGQHGAHLVASPRISQPASRSASRSGARCCRATARSTSSVSAAPQMPVRRILALTTICSAMSRSAERVDIDVADAFEMGEDRHARLVLHARDQALAAARHDDVDECRRGPSASRRRRRGRWSARAGSRPPAGRPPSALRPGRRGSPAMNSSAVGAAAQDHRRCRP